MRVARAVAVGILLLLALGIATDAAAQVANVLGTWKGTGKAVHPSGFQTGVISAKITSQSGNLFRGTMTIAAGGTTRTYNLTGYIAGTLVRMTVSERASDDKTVNYIDATYVAASSSMKCVVQSANATTGYVTLTRQ